MGLNVLRFDARLLLAATLAGVAVCGFPAASGAVQSPIPPVVGQAPELMSSAAVAAYYQERGNAPIWLRDATTAEAAKLLGPILRRATVDGFAAGPRLAQEVETALARAQGVKPAEQIIAADRLVSAAWALYVQALARPVSGMTFGDKRLAPQPPSVSRILFEAGSAPSLAAHVRQVSDVNPIYAALREAAWMQAQQGGPAGVDKRVLANLERARLLPGRGRSIVVDTASARLWLFNDGRVEDAMKVIVGKRDTPTPMLAGTIHYATFNPYWNIPTDVARRTVAPLVLKRGTSYLAKARYEVAADWTDGAKAIDPAGVDWKAVADGSASVRIRQLPGASNMMGAIKFGFANDLGIYLHDTPQKGLFAKARRNFSLGCVRVEDAQRLARWLLGRDPAAPSTEPEQHVALPRGVPIYITYLTAEASNGVVTFAADVYRRDPAGETQFAGQAAKPAASPDVIAASAPTEERSEAVPH
jgi:murein L,D-transpeptidase YcbB/YkuD